jgi:hypothetical protein
MALSEVSIANRAIQILGSSERIEAMDQDHPNARTMSAAFEPVRNALIRRYKWGFAIKRVSLAADATDTVWGGLNRYAFPNDLCRILRDDESGIRLDWKIEGRFIVTKDGAPLNVKYLAIITDPGQFDPSFAEALSHALAVATCEEITGSTSKLQDIREGFRMAMAEAKQMNAYEEDAVEALDDSWINARL